MKPLVVFFRMAIVLVAAAFAALSAQTTSPSASLSGSVSNAGTGRFLDGAAVELVGTGRTALTDSTGEFRFPDFVPGNYTVTVSYLGLETQRLELTLAAGERARRTFDLGTAIYKMDSFTVSGEREGNAAAITRQRNADSVKHVVSMDAFGNLANDNAGELLLRLPGIAGTHDLDGNISTVSIRGAAANLNMVTVDGNLMASNFGDSRSFALRSISGALFDEIEVTKAPTPDMPADSIGGAVNFKSASPLDMKGARRITASASFRWAPRWVENVPMAYDHPLHPTLKVGWQQVLGIFGGARNLGVTFNAFYSENASGGYTGTNAYQTTLSRRAFLYDYQSRDIYNNRKQTSASLKLDYRLSPGTTLTLNALVNEDDQPFNRWYVSRAVTGQNLVTFNAAGQPTGTGTIFPDYTENVTRVRAQNTSRMVLNSQGLGFNDQQAQFSGSAKHKRDRLDLSANAAFSRSHSLLDSGEHGNRAGGGDFEMELRNLGWTIDRGVSEEYPRWIQTEGPDISNAALYVPLTMARRDNSKDIDIFSARTDAIYQLPASRPVTLKTGASFRSQEMRRVNADRQWTPTTATAAAGSLASLYNPRRVETSEEERIGRQIPFIDATDVWDDLNRTPTRWTENLYYAETRKFIGNDRVREDVTAGYGQGQIVLGRLKSLAGVRYERTAVDAAGYVASPVLSTTAQRTANPAAAAAADYRTRRKTSGHYDDFFPGVYLTYSVTKNLLLRANWSNSIGRPGFGTLVPTFSVNTTTETVNANNAGLGPQTSENWDAGVEYYFEPVGQLSANVFRKNMNDFIVTGNVGTVGSGPNNGFGGSYAGYDLTSTFNGGAAKIEGIELAYQQRFEFLPRPFSGLSAFANYTWLRTSGDYGTVNTAPPSTKDVLNFIPETLNVGLSYSYRGFGARVTWNETGRYLNAYNDNPALLRYTRRRGMLDASVSYRFWRAATVFIDVRNITNSPRSWERPAGLTNAYIFFTSVNFGVKGEF